MKYKIKLFVILMGLTLITNGVLLAVFYHDAQKHLREQMNSKALSIAAAVAANINGDALASLNKRSDEASPIYHKYETLLRRVRDNNRRSDVFVKYIYTLMPKIGNPTQLVFGVDANEAGLDKSHIGDLYKFKSKQPYLLNEATAQAGFVQDKRGEWLAAHAPIYDKKGRVVAAVAVDIDDHIVKARLNHLLKMGFLGLGLALLLAVLLAYFLAKQVTKSLDTLTDAVGKIGKGDLETKVYIKTKDEFAVLGEAVNAMVLGFRQRDNLKTSLARYVSNQVAEKIIETGKLPEVQGERRKITVLFCDVRNFTAFAENLPPEEVVSLLNEAFEKMIDAVFEYEGMLDKFLGDGFMAIFGAPLDDAIQEEHAINTALAMQKSLIALTERWQVERGINFRMGIGINTGVAIVGNIGSKQRMEYTAIGDTVNLAARLESATKELGTRILVSEQTYKAVVGKFSCKSLGSIHVKGRVEPVMVYEVNDNDISE